MDIKFKYIIPGLAIVAALVVYYARQGRIRGLRSKKRGYFITSFMIALALLGCGFDNSAAKGKTDGPGCSRDGGGQDDPERIRELNKTREWKAFKALWKGIDAIEPGHAPDTNTYSIAPYVNMKVEDHEQKRLLYEQLERNIDSLCTNLLVLVENKLLDSLEQRLLQATCHARAEYIYYGNQSLMMRMIPPPGQVEKEHSITAIEIRTDALLELRKKQKIDSAELQQALANIQNEIRTYSILDIIGKRGFGYYRYGDADGKGKDSLSITDRAILQFEMSREKFMKTYNASRADENTKLLFESYVRSSQELDAFRRVYPQYCELIKDLIVND